MFGRITAALAATALLSLPASAQTTVLIDDNFDSLSQGVPYITGFANWNVLGNTVDVLRQGNSYGISCAGGSGACVDIDGTPGPGGLASKVQYSFAAGDVARLQFDLSGNQRGNDNKWTFDNLLASFSFSGSATIADAYVEIDGFSLGDPGFAAQHDAVTPVNFDIQSIPYDAPWTTWAIGFRVLNATNIGVSLSSSSNDLVGPVIDNVMFTRTTEGAANVPEPASLALLAVGFVALGYAGRRRSIGAVQH